MTHDDYMAQLASLHRAVEETRAYADKHPGGCVMFRRPILDSLCTCKPKFGELDQARISRILGSVAACPGCSKRLDHQRRYCPACDVVWRYSERETCPECGKADPNDDAERAKMQKTKGGV